MFHCQRYDEAVSPHETLPATRQGHIVKALVDAPAELDTLQAAWPCYIANGMLGLWATVLPLHAARQCRVVKARDEAIAGRDTLQAARQGHIAKALVGAPAERDALQAAWQCYIANAMMRLFPHT